MRDEAGLDVLLVTEFAPMHSGHGGHVYPFFLCEQLTAAGLEVKTLFIGDGAGYGRPFSFDGRVEFPAWLRLGRLAISTSPRDWARYGLAPVWPMLQRWRKAQHPPATAEAGAAAPDTARLDVAAAVARLNPSVAIVNLPHLLDAFPGEGERAFDLAVLCHDVIHERTRLYARNGWHQDFQAMTAEEEGRLLRKADLVVAISEEDAAAFARLAPKARIVACLPPIFRRTAALETPLPPLDGPMRCGFIGSGGPLNGESMHWLIDAWAQQSAELGDMELVIAGTVANGLDRALPSRVTVLGPVAHVEPFYRACHLSLAIVLQGTGVKIKVLEALRYGRPVITSEEGLRGFGAAARDVFPTVASHAELAGLLAGLSNAGALEALAAQQRAWAERCLDPALLMRPLLAELQAVACTKLPAA